MGLERVLTYIGNILDSQDSEMRDVTVDEHISPSPPPRANLQEGMVVLANNTKLAGYLLHHDVLVTMDTANYLNYPQMDMMANSNFYNSYDETIVHAATSTSQGSDSSSNSYESKFWGRKQC